jgi:hypothetical protein
MKAPIPLPRRSSPSVIGANHEGDKIRISKSWIVAVAEYLGFVKIMGIKEDGPALLLDFQDEIPDGFG